MQAAVLRSLEFDRVRDALASRTLTPLGRARARTLEPAVDPGEVSERLALTTEAVRFVHEGGSLGLEAQEDLPAIVATLAIEAQPLDPLGLLGLARFLDSAARVATAARRAGGPRLSAVAAGVASFADEVAAVERAIEPSGEVSDRASGALREIRERLRQQRARLRGSLESLSKGRDTARYLQDHIVTDRNGRYVLVVRAEHREAIPGIVHGSSTSGASLYLEPLATVELNNAVVALGEREKAEIQRILLALTQAFRERGDELDATLEAAGQLDDLHARVDLARRMDAIAPDVVNDGSLEFLGARHPLLIPAVRDLVDPPGARSTSAAQPVASTLRLVGTARVLVISGPNTGGKTVALKAFGLLALMAQAGLLVPAEPGSRLTPLRSVFADIGDEQSIAASLSTFSAHVSNIVAMDRALELPALVLLDEVGGGTDPAEGGALGAAIVDHFRRRGAHVVATTHDELMKSYAATTQGVVAAGFGFDPASYAPTYRLQYGAPGRSLALEIAGRLGLPEDVIADARTRRTGRESLLAEHLARLDEQFARLGAERADVAADRRALDAERHELLARESRLTEREALLRKRLDDRLNEKLREARTEVDRIVGTLKQRADRLAEQAEARAAARGPLLSTGEVGGLRREARDALGEVGRVVGGDEQPHADQALAGPPAIGATVWVAPFQTEGVVRSLAGGHAEVDVRGKRVRTRLADLRQAGARPAPRETAPRGRTSHVSVHAVDRGTAAVRDLVLVGCTVDEALDRAAKRLDEALLADEGQLRVVHGYGTGRLREALTRFFQEHPLVASVSAAADHDGGRGATIVELKP